MLSLYLGALAFGGTLLVASMVLGAGQKDVSHGDTDDAGDKDHGGDGLAWLPVTSLRFWTFFLAFGGATGALLTATTSLGVGPVAAAAWAVGWASGVAIVASVKSLRKGSVGSEVSSKDLRGETAEVTVALGKDRIGKVRVVAKGRIHDVIAETDDTQLSIGDKVMILGEGAEGRVQVTKS
jgi:hypothetical protein